MAVASQSGQSRRATSRGRSQAKSSQAKSSQAKGSQARRSNASSRARSASARSRSAAKASNGNQPSTGANHSNQHETLTNVAVSVVSAVAGVAGGVLITRKRNHRKVLGIPVPDKVDLGGVADQIGSAGRQFGELAGEVRAVRQKAEKLGRLLS